MRNGKPMSKLEIAARVKARKPFVVTTKSERHHVLVYASYIDAKVQTKERDEGGYSVTFTV
jgi:hypothetical protein